MLETISGKLPYSEEQGLLMNWVRLSNEQYTFTLGGILDWQHVRLRFS